MIKKLVVFIAFCYIGLLVVPLILPNEDSFEAVVVSSAGEEDSYDFAELEDYVTGVVAAEMPAVFNEEALKAQAVCARTYAIRYMEERGSTSIPYDIYQAYCSVEDMRKKWGDDFDEYYAKISGAVKATAGEIMIYENEPVLAVFHSMSSGKTENSENIWGGEVDYLKSVDSSFDEASPGFISRAEFDISYVKDKLKENEPDIVFDDSFLIITERTEADYVKTVKAGNKTFTGKQIRELLGLRSANFTIEFSGDKIIFVTKGFGHGAGLSQYGANHMAEAGSTYTEILEHYYTGVELAKIKLKI